MRTFVLLLLAAAALQADSLSFINGDVSLGISTTLTDTNNDVTATFSSAADPGGFVTASASGFFSWGPEMLYDPGPANVTDIALDIGFSTRLSDISMNFGTVTSGPFELSAYLDGTLVGTATATGTTIAEYPEGAISFDGGTFDSIVLTSPDTPYFAIGNISGDTETPEPSYLIVPGLAALALLHRHRKYWLGNRL